MSQRTKDPVKQLEGKAFLVIFPLAPFLFWQAKDSSKSMTRIDNQMPARGQTGNISK